MKKNDKYVIYIGDFDFRNENVQSNLVKNNGIVLKSLGYKLIYIGIDTKNFALSKKLTLREIKLEGDDLYNELPNTFSFKGLFRCWSVCNTITSYLDSIIAYNNVEFVITYQSPSYAIALKKIAVWCNRNNIKYVVNSADLPTFDLQPYIKKKIMKANWGYLHRINKKYADGIISVSKFIESFYKKEKCCYALIPPLFNTFQRNIELCEPENEVSFIYAGTPFINTGRSAKTSGMKDRLDKIIDLFLLLSKIEIFYKFKIIGISKEEYLIAVPRQEILLKDNKNIEFLGRLSHKHTLALISVSDFSINYRDSNLMTKAGFSTKIVESISLGTPVIINSISDTFDYLKEGTSGFELTGDMQSDLKKIILLCKLSKEDRIRLKTNLISERIFDTSNSIYLEKMELFISCLNRSKREIE